MQARSTTNKTSSMARQAILLPQNNITTPVNARMSSTHRIGTSNGESKGQTLNQTYQNIPKNNNLFQTEDLPKTTKASSAETTEILGQYTNNQAKQDGINRQYANAMQ